MPTAGAGESSNVKYKKDVGRMPNKTLRLIEKNF